MPLKLNCLEIVLIWFLVELKNRRAENGHVHGNLPPQFRIQYGFVFTLFRFFCWRFMNVFICVFFRSSQSKFWGKNSVFAWLAMEKMRPKWSSIISILSHNTDLSKARSGAHLAEQLLRFHISNSHLNVNVPSMTHTFIACLLRPVCKTNETKVHHTHTWVHQHFSYSTFG